MNFLAHLYLSSDDPDALAGSLLPDLVRGPLPDDANPILVAACRLHRLVDAFTDTHLLHAQSRQHVRPSHSRYAGILVDMFYDHILARDWLYFSQEPLPVFTQRVYRAFAGNRDRLPDPMSQALTLMIEQDWLQAYASIEGMRQILAQMSRRFTRRFHRPVDLTPAMDDMVMHDALLTDEFHRFFPQLIAYARLREPAVSRPA